MDEYTRDRLRGEIAYAMRQLAEFRDCSRAFDALERAAELLDGETDCEEAFAECVLDDEAEVDDEPLPF